MRRLLALLVLLVAFAAHARIGGGDSYSGGSSSSGSSSGSSSYSSSSSSDSSYSGSSGSSSGGGGGGGSEAGLALFLFFGLFFLGGLLNTGKRTDRIFTTTTTHGARPSKVRLSALRAHDPNFSEIVFTDFCYSLFARLHEARGRGRVDDLAPYVSAAVREGLKKHAPAGLSSVDAIVIGAFTIADSGLDSAMVEAVVAFDANYTETAAGATRRYYVREEWTLERARDLLSPAPEHAKAEHCPKCAAPLQTRTDGACLHCGTIVTDGSFQWFVRTIEVREQKEQPPELGGGGGPEPGLDRPTVYGPWIRRSMDAFVKAHPGFTWDSFEQRVRYVATELQAAWSTRDWKRARPLETGALFQTHQYWIDEYIRQNLRNLVDDLKIETVDVADVASDAFYDAITVRIFSSGFDYTLDANGDLAGGTRNQRRRWSEYWTFIRGRAAAPAGSRVCPNCGGKLAAGQTAVCDYCGGKVRTGEFPWVLSRIEQDEAYRG